jgi:N-acetylglutamate synthase-like GNAT family acetyltransferase
MACRWPAPSNTWERPSSSASIPMSSDAPPWNSTSTERSVAARGDAQGAGVGHALVEAALSLATELQADFVYLLTTTAQRFFPRFGFEVIARDEVPATVRQSVEFRSACPASAVVMRRPQR